MENATQKQIDFINDLLAKKQKTFANVQDLSIKQASILIYQLKNDLELKIFDKKQDSKDSEILDNKSQSINEYLESINYQELSNKYNLKIEKTKEGWKGSKSNESFIDNTREIKKYINTLLKKEFKNIDYSLKVFTHHYSRGHIEIDFTLKGTSEELRENFNLLSQEEKHNIFRNADSNNYYNAVTFEASEIYYNNYFKFSKRKEGLKNGYKKFIDFISLLLDSFSYDFSDTMTDYFNFGIETDIIIDITDREENKIKEFYDFFSHAKKDIEIISEYPLEDPSPELKERIKKHQEEEQAKLEKFIKEQEELKAAREQEEKRRNEEKERLTSSNNYEVQELENPIILKGCRFSTWNKPTTLEEAKEFIEKYPSSKNAGTIAEIFRIVNIKNQDLYNYFINNTLDNMPFIDKGGCGLVRFKNGKIEELSEEEHRTIYNSSETDLSLAKRGIYSARSCILIQLNGQDKFIVDPSGFNYCRYIGLLPLPDYQEIKQEETQEPILSKNEKNLLEECKKLQNNQSFDILDFGSNRNFSEEFKKQLEKIHVSMICSPCSINFRKNLKIA